MKDGEMSFIRDFQKILPEQFEVLLLRIVYGNKAEVNNLAIKIYGEQQLT